MNIPRYFYYITHIDNLKSILKNGILSRSQIKDENSLLVKLGLANRIKSIHSEDIVQRRKNKIFNDKPLWSYVNLYFQPRNPMLYVVTKNFQAKNIVVLQINSDVINSDDVGITDGNAASNDTHYFTNTKQGLAALTQEQFNKEYWNDSDDAKRKIMAELLVHDRISPDKIIGIFVANEEIAKTIRQNITIGALNIIPDSKMFFLPERQKRISDYITLAKGDMFFSKMQTFTVSVNTVGIMGKGLASRAKYQFPDVYVHYQDLCRQKKLRMGVPFLYKRKEDFERSLSEETQSLITENGNRWFLMFPTKNHWKTNSPIDGIEKGLQWLLDNYKDLGIKSIALPSLGCGLGGLDWKNVGPLMCKYLNQMDIQSCIYLPTERQVPPEYLEPQFLLNEKQPRTNNSACSNSLSD